MILLIGLILTGLISIGGWTYKSGVYSKGGFSFNSNDRSSSYSNGPLTVTIDGDGNKTMEGKIKRGDSSCTVSGGGFNCSINAGPVQCNVTVDSENNVTSFDTDINYRDLINPKVLNPLNKGLDIGLGAADVVHDAASNSIINRDAVLQQEMKRQGI